MPTLDTPEAIQAAEYYASLLKEFGPDGVLSYTYDQSLNTLKQGRANYTTFNQAWLVQLGDPESSKVASPVNYSLMPQGPAGRFPGVASHGWGIPVGSQNKDAAWAFISWAVSKNTIERIDKEKGYGAVCRRSVITSDYFTKSLTLNGDSVAPLYLQVLELGGKSGYMKYRTVPVFPQVGDKINKAMERIATPGVWVGAAAQISRATVNSTFTLEKGDLLVLYTDGVTEAANAGGERFDPVRLGQVVEQSCDQPSNWKPGSGDAVSVTEAPGM